MAALLSCLKQVNAVLVCAGLGAAAWHDGRGARGRHALLLVVSLLPAPALYLLWRRHVAVPIPSREVRFLPLAEWRLAPAPDFLHDDADQVARRPAHFIVMAVVCWLAVVALLTRGRPGLDRGAASLAIVPAVTFLGYTLLLLTVYLGAVFHGDAVGRAARSAVTAAIGRARSGGPLGGCGGAVARPRRGWPDPEPPGRGGPPAVRSWTCRSCSPRRSALIKPPP